MKTVFFGPGFIPFASDPYSAIFAPGQAPGARVGWLAPDGTSAYGTVRVAADGSLAIVTDAELAAAAGAAPAAPALGTAVREAVERAFHGLDLDLDVALDGELDAAAALDALRRRRRAAASAAPRCQCGTGVHVAGPAHSTWCALYRGEP